jgi:tetratricopeptide (TPR) repeat protein
VWRPHPSHRPGSSYQSCIVPSSSLATGRYAGWYGTVEASASVDVDAKSRRVPRVHDAVGELVGVREHAIGVRGVRHVFLNAEIVDADVEVQRRRHADRAEALARRLADGEDADASARATHGVALDALEAALQAYVRTEIYEHVELAFAEGVPVRVDAEAAAMDVAEVDAWLADLLAHLQRGPEAIPLLQRALRVRSDLPRALATLGVLRFRQGNRTEAMSMLERAAAAGPGIESVQFVYGWALAIARPADAPTLQRAREALERAVALHPWYPAAMQMLAVVYSATGEFTRVRDLLRPLVRAAPDNQEVALLGPILARPRDDESGARARMLLGETSKLQEHR